MSFASGQKSWGYDLRCDFRFRRYSVQLHVHLENRRRHLSSLSERRSYCGGFFYFNTIEPKADAVSFLSRMKEEGIQTCITTATDRYQVKTALRRCGMDIFFSDIFICSEVGHGKDKPIIFRKALEHLQTTRADTIVFEDVFHALKTASGDGFITAAVYDSSEKRQKDLRNLADFFLESYHITDSFWKFALA